MDDMKVYEFALKMNTHLKRQAILANKMLEQELGLSRFLGQIITIMPYDIYQSLIEILENRTDTLMQMGEANTSFVKHIEELQKELTNVKSR